jgi:predicted dehydrogenase
MQLALLGADAGQGGDAGGDALALASAAADSRQFTLSWIADAEHARADLERIAPLAKWLPDWESLLALDGCDGVIFAASGDAREEQLRRLVQSAVPVLVVHPAIESIVGFEIDMIRADTRGVIEPYFPGYRHPALDELEHCIGAEGERSIGAVEQVVFERRLAAS